MPAVKPEEAVLASLDFTPGCRIRWGREGSECGLPALSVAEFFDGDGVVVRKPACDGCVVRMHERGNLISVEAL